MTKKYAWDRSGPWNGRGPWNGSGPWSGDGNGGHGSIANLLTDFSAIRTYPDLAQAITSITAGGVYTPTPVTLNSGSPTTGNWYKISAQDGVDFTTIGSADNVVGTYFKATGDSVTLDANDTLDDHGPAYGYLIPAGLGDVVDGDSNLLPIGQGQTCSLGTWTDGSVPLLGVDLSDMVGPVQDPDDFSLTDTNGVVSIAGNVVTLTDGDRDEDYYATKDYGTDHFGDFSMSVSANVTTMADNSNAYFPFWAISNSDDDLKDIDDAGGSAIYLALRRLTTSTYKIELFSIDSGTITSIDVSSGIPVGTESFFKITRSSTTLTCGIYSTDALEKVGGTPDVDTVSGTVVGNKFSHVYYIGSYNNSLLNYIISGTVSNLRINEIDSGSMIPTEPPATWTISDNSIVGPYVEIGNDLVLINSGTLTLGTVYFVNTTEVDNFGSGVTQYEYFTSVGSETCDASNTVYLVSETGIQWNGLGSATATLSSIGITQWTRYLSKGIFTDITAGNINFELEDGGSGLLHSSDGTYYDRMTGGTTDTFIVRGDSTSEGVVLSDELSLTVR